MEVCSHISFQVNNDVKNLHGLYKDTNVESTYELMGGFSVNEAAKFLNIQDEVKEVSSSSDNGVLQKKPVSAMKGSREKTGVSSGKKLSVKWAPDVYDPVVPRSLVQMVITSRPRKHGKKSPNSNSSSSSQGSKGKNKKKGRKRGGFS